MQKNSVSAMNVIEIMKENPNLKIKRNKKVNYRSYAGSDGHRGL